MIHISDVFARPRRRSPSVRLTGLAVLAGLSYGIAVAAPAAAASTDWRPACQFKTVPGGAAAGIQYDACMHQQSCQNLANAAGREFFDWGCFGVKPERAAQLVVRR